MAAKKATTKPEEAPEAEEASEAEEIIDLVDIPFRGHTFVVRRSRDRWSTKGLGYLSEGQYNLFVKYQLEIARSGQWDQLCEVCVERRDFTAFFEVFAKVIAEDCVD